MSAPAASTPPQRRLGARRILTYVVGLLLLIAAIVAVVSRADALGHAARSAQSASPWLIAAAILLPLANIVVISASFWVLTTRFGRVGGVEMGSLITSSWLLNHLPLRPGLVGRVGYHKAVNGILVAKSVRVVAEQFACGMAALASVVLVSVATPMNLRLLLVVLFALGTAFAVAGCIGRSILLNAASPITLPSYAAAFGFRILDMTLWIARYWVLFALVGVRLDTRQAAAVTVASQGAMLSPVPLGLREWAVGAAHALYGAGSIPSSGSDAVDAMAPGVAADLVNRGAELLVCVPLGLWATLWLVRRLRRALAASPHPAAAPSV